MIRDVLVDAGDMAGLFCQFPGDIAAAATDVDDVGARADGFDGHGVGGDEAELHVVSLLDGADVEFAVVEEVPFVEFRAQHCRGRRPRRISGR